MVHAKHFMVETWGVKIFLLLYYHKISMGNNLEETILSKALLGEFLTKSLRQAAAFPYVPNSGPGHAVRQFPNSRGGKFGGMVEELNISTPPTLW